MKLFRKLTSKLNKNSYSHIDVKDLRIEDLNNMTDKLIELNKREQHLENALKQKEHLIGDLKAISKLPEDEAMLLDRSLHTISKANSEKKSLMGKMKNLTNQEIHDDFYGNFRPKLNEIQKAEDKRRMAKSDMNYLEGEKGYLSYQKEKYEKMIRVLRTIGISITCLVGLTVLFFTVLMTVYEKNMMLPGVILFGFTLFSLTWSFIWSRNLTYYLKLNGKKQTKATELLNKAKLKYVRHTQFIDSQLKKYRVESVTQLVKFYEDFIRYREINQQYKEMSKYEGETLANIESIFHKYNILEDEYLLEHGDIMRDKSSCDKEIQEIKSRLPKEEKELDAVRKEMSQIWKVIHHLKTEDPVMAKEIADFIHKKLV